MDFLVEVADEKWSHNIGNVLKEFHRLIEDSNVKKAHKATAKVLMKFDDVTRKCILLRIFRLSMKRVDRIYHDEKTMAKYLLARAIIYVMSKKGPVQVPFFVKFDIQEFHRLIKDSNVEKAHKATAKALMKFDDVTRKSILLRIFRLSMERVDQIYHDEKTMAKDLLAHANMYVMSEKGPVQVPFFAKFDISLETHDANRTLFTDAFVKFIQTGNITDVDCYSLKNKIDLNDLAAECRGVMNYLTRSAMAKWDDYYYDVFAKFRELLESPKINCYHEATAKALMEFDAVTRINALLDIFNLSAEDISKIYNRKKKMADYLLHKAKVMIHTPNGLIKTPFFVKAEGEKKASRTVFTVYFEDLILSQTKCHDDHYAEATDNSN